MGGSTFEDIELGASTSTAGSGLQSGSIAAPVTKVATVAGEIITTIQLDLQNLSGSTTTATVIGNAEARDGAGASPAFLYEHSNTLNGILYKVEMSCLEDPAGGQANTNFAISGSTLGTFEHGDTVAGSPFTVFSGNYIAENETNVNNVVNSSDGAFMYLTSGAAGGAAGGKFTAGKLIIRLYGHLDF